VTSQMKAGPVLIFRLICYQILYLDARAEARSSKKELQDIGR
jgi:hypothetical protein